MKNFEEVYNELEELFITHLPVYIQKINEEINDGIILKDFTNTKLSEDCKTQPSFKLKIETAEYDKKDRIIENTVFAIGVEIKLEKDYENKTVELWRYEKVIEKMIAEYTGRNWLSLEVNGVKENTIKLKITCEE